MTDELIDYLKKGSKIAKPKAGLSYSAVKRAMKSVTETAARATYGAYGAVPLPAVVALVSAVAVGSALLGRWSSRRVAASEGGGGGDVAMI